MKTNKYDVIAGTILLLATGLFIWLCAQAHNPVANIFCVALMIVTPILVGALIVTGENVKQ